MILAAALVLAFAATIATPAGAGGAEIPLGHGATSGWFSVAGDGWRNLRRFNIHLPGSRPGTRFAPDSHWYVCGRQTYLRQSRSIALQDSLTLIEPAPQAGDTSSVLQLQGEIDALLDHYIAGMPQPARTRRAVVSALADACSRPPNDRPPVVLRVYRGESSVGHLQPQGFVTDGPIRRFWTREYPTRRAWRRPVADAVAGGAAASERFTPFEVEIVGGIAAAAINVEVDCSRRSSRVLERIEYDADGGIAQKLGGSTEAVAIDPLSPAGSEISLVCLID